MGSQDHVPNAAVLHRKLSLYVYIHLYMYMLPLVVGKELKYKIACAEYR